MMLIRRLPHYAALVVGLSRGSLCSILLNLCCSSRLRCIFLIPRQACNYYSELLLLRGPLALR